MATQAQRQVAGALHDSTFVSFDDVSSSTVSFDLPLWQNILQRLAQADLLSPRSFFRIVARPGRWRASRRTQCPPTMTNVIKNSPTSVSPNSAMTTAARRGWIEPLDHGISRLLGGEKHRTTPMPKMCESDHHRNSVRGCCGCRFEISANCLSLFFGEILGQLDLDFGKQIARRLIGRSHAVSFDPQPLAARRIRRHLQRDRAVRRRHIDGRPLNRLGQRHRHAHIEPIAGPAKMRMRAHANRQQDIARRPVARAGLALSAKANFLAVIDAGRDLTLIVSRLPSCRCTVSAASPPNTADANGIVSSCLRSLPRSRRPLRTPRSTASAVELLEQIGETAAALSAPAPPPPNMSFKSLTSNGYVCGPLLVV